MRPSRFVGWRVALTVARIRTRATGMRHCVKRDGDRWAVQPAMPKVAEPCS